MMLSLARNCGRGIREAVDFCGVVAVADSALLGVAAVAVAGAAFAISLNSSNACITRSAGPLASKDALPRVIERSKLFPSADT